MSKTKSLNLGKVIRQHLIFTSEGSLISKKND